MTDNQRTRKDRNWQGISREKTVTAKTLSLTAAPSALNLSPDQYSLPCEDSTAHPDAPLARRQHSDSSSPSHRHQLVPLHDVSSCKKIVDTSQGNLPTDPGPTTSSYRTTSSADSCCHPSTTGDHENEIEHGITFDFANQLINNPSLKSISKAAKLTIMNLLQDIETAHKSRLEEALASSPTQISSASSTNPVDEASKDTLLILEKLQYLEKSVKELKEASSASPHSPTSQFLPPAKTAEMTYAQAASRTKETIVLKPAKNTTTIEVVKQLQNLECPKEVNLTNLRVLPTRIEVRCSSKEGKDKLHTYLQNQQPIAENCILEDKRPPTARIIIHNLPESINESEVASAICNKGCTTDDISLVLKHASRFEGKEHWVWEVPRHLLPILTSSRWLLIGFHRFHIRHYVRIIRCKNCQVLGDHFAFECRNRKCCVYCGEKHADESCTKQTPTCINCQGYNKDQHEEANRTGKCSFRDTSHPANASSCPSYRSLIQELSQTY